MRWEWHQMDNMQIICTSFQTDNHASTSPLLIFYKPDVLPDDQPTVSKHWRQFRLAQERTWNYSMAHRGRSCRRCTFVCVQTARRRSSWTCWSTSSSEDWASSRPPSRCLRPARASSSRSRSSSTGSTPAPGSQGTCSYTTYSTRWRRNNQPTGRCQSQCPRKNGPPKYNGVVFEILGRHHWNLYNII